MKELRQREPRYENRALLDLCYQIPCTADWPHDCDGQSEPAHSNQARHGKGKSLKAHDCFVAALCRNAHRELDQGRMFDRQAKFCYWQRAHEKTLLEMFVRDFVKPVIDVPRWAFERFKDANFAASVAENVKSNEFLLKKLRRSRKTGHANGRSTESPSKIYRRPA